jgi:hypothetical protein
LTHGKIPLVRQRCDSRQSIPQNSQNLPASCQLRQKSRFCFAHLGVGCLIQAVSGRKYLLTCKHDASIFFPKPAVNRSRTGRKNYKLFKKYRKY